MDPGKALRALTRTSAAAVSVAILVTTASQTARADDAAQILKAMTDYTGAQKSISAAFDSDIEVITAEIQKIQFTSSGQMSLNRPDRLRIRRTGGYADVELTYDGKTLSLYGNNAKSYVQADAAGTIDQVIDTLQAKTGAAMPGTDLLLSNSYDRHRRQAYWSRRCRWSRMRAPRISRNRHRLPDMTLIPPPAHSPQLNP